MKIIKKHLTNGQYITDIFVKKSIFLHHTAGTTADGAWRWWNSTPERVGTPYIIDRDGTIIECFDPKYWAWHLGIKGDDDFQEKHGISIELVSAGNLYKEGNKFVFYPLFPNKTRFITIPNSEVITFNNLWRGKKYFHKYTDEQINSLKELIWNLYEQFPELTLDFNPEQFFDYNEEIFKNRVPGVWGHSAVRADKSDIYPDDRVVGMLKTLKEELLFKYNPEKPLENESKKVLTNKTIKNNKPDKKS